MHFNQMGSHKRSIFAATAPLCDAGAGRVETICRVAVMDANPLNSSRDTHAQLSGKETSDI